MWGRLAVVLVSLVLFMSGCAGEQDYDVVGSEAVVIDDPNDFSYLDEPDASERPHIHDYWGGQREMVLAEGSMTWSGSHVAGTASTIGGAGLAVPDGSMVIPGTRWVNVTATWRNERPFPVDFWVEYHTANGSEGRLKIASGETVSLEVAEEMNDLPHAKRTRWEFKPVVTGSGSAWTADVRAHVEIVIAKAPGELPYAPAHVSPWGDNASLTLFEVSGPLNDPRPGTGANGDRPPASPLLRPVPVGTSSLVIRLHYNSSTPTALHYDPVLNYRGADRTGFHEAGKATKRETRNKEGVIGWDLEVKPEMWDSPYATGSDWRFTFFWGGEVANSKSTNGANWMQGDFRFEIVAVRSTIQAGEASG